MLRVAFKNVISRKVHTSVTTSFKLSRLFSQDKYNNPGDNYANQDVFSQLFDDDKPEIKQKEETFEFTGADLKDVIDELEFEDLDPDILKNYDSGTRTGAEQWGNSWKNLTYSSSTRQSDPWTQFDSDTGQLLSEEVLTKDGYLLTIFTSLAEESGQLSHRQRLQRPDLNLPEIPDETLHLDLIPKKPKNEKRGRGKPNNSTKKRKQKSKKRAAQSTEYERLSENRNFRLSKKKSLTPAEFIQTFEDYIKKDYPQFLEPKPTCKSTEYIPELENGVWSPNPSDLNLETSPKIGVEHSTRKDFRSKDCTIFSIDPASAADIDDAIHIRVLQKPNSSNNFTKKIEIGVHIADTTHFINPETEPRMYDYARKNGTTRYWPHKVEHLMPRNLSSNACSLLPDVDRLTMSVVLEFTGKVVEADSVDGSTDDSVDCMDR
jgi:hypothetical protein